MRTVKQLIEELRKFPMDAKAYAYEGEVTGVVIRSANGSKELGHIPATARDCDDAGTIINKKSR